MNGFVTIISSTSVLNACTSEHPVTRLFDSQLYYLIDIDEFCDVFGTIMSRLDYVTHEKMARLVSNWSGVNAFSVIINLKQTSNMKVGMKFSF